MKRFRQIFVICSLLIKFISNNGFCQDGELFISNFWPFESYSNQAWSISQNNEEVMFFATRRGVVTFDSDEWDIIKVPGIPFSLKWDSIFNRMYVGCVNLLGYLQKNEKGYYEFVTLYKPRENIGIIYDILIDKDEIYCFSDYAISKVSNSETSMQYEWISNTMDNFSGAFLYNKKVYLNISDAGLFVLEDNEIWPTPNGHKTAGVDIVFSIPFLKNSILLGTSDNRLLIFEKGDFKTYEIKDQEYVSASVLSGGVKVSDSVLAISTLIGGSLLIDVNTGKTLHRINYQTGLPDDEVICMGLEDNGLWLSHSYGLSRVEQAFPVRNYSSYKGLQGNVLSVVTPGETLYVSTSEGVYYLQEEKEFKEKVVLKKAEQEKIKEYSSKKRKKKKTFFSFFKFDKEKDKTTTSVKKQKSKRKFRIIGIRKDSRRNLFVEEAPTPKYIKEKIFELLSVSYSFKKVQGVDDKCKQMIALNNRIIVSANNGLYEIIDGKAKVIIENTYINIIATDSTKKIIAAATPEELYLLYLVNDKWNIERHESPNQFIHSIYISSADSLWLGGYDLVYSVVREEITKEVTIKAYSFHHVLYEPVEIIPVRNKLYFFQATSFNTLEKGAVVRTNFFESIRSDEIKDIVAMNGYTWIKVNDSWSVYPGLSGIEENKVFLNIFNDLKSVHCDSESNLWMITNSNNIYKISSPAEMNYIHKKPLVYINNLSSINGIYFELSHPRIDYKDNSLEFNIMAPYYLKQGSTIYQYLVEGLMDGWSGWEQCSKISIPYLPPGNYILHVKARNVLGKESDITSFKFKIEPPFWKTKLFYVIVLLLVALVIFFFIKFRERHLIKEKEYLSSLVKRRTEEIEKQKDEIEFINHEITSSIEYAKKIQTAVLPSKDKLDNILNDYFILFKPRDIVSGDFYWANNIGNKVVIVAADCTGHGVPGAFMSILGVSILNKTVVKEKNLNAGDILNLLRDDVVATLSGQGNSGDTRDGINIALCIFDRTTLEIQFAGAYNSILIVRDDELIEYKADRMPVGFFSWAEESI